MLGSVSSSKLNSMSLGNSANMKVWTSIFDVNINNKFNIILMIFTISTLKPPRTVLEKLCFIIKHKDYFVSLKSKQQPVS